mgnify:CR=1 FL=1
MVITETDSRGVATVTLNNADKHNAFDDQLIAQISATFDALEADLGVRIVILQATGRSFSAGADLAWMRRMADYSYEENHRDATLMAAMFRRINTLSKPTIARVHGAAFGGGCELSLMCDFIYAADHARFALPEVGLGIIPGCGGTQTLARAVGERRAKELVLTGKPFDAHQAERWGMVNQVCPGSELLNTTLACAQLMADGAPLSVRQSKKAIHQGLQGDLRSGLNYEVAAYMPLIHTQDRREGTLAFNEKRKPRFTGA